MKGIPGRREAASRPPGACPWARRVDSGTGQAKGPEREPGPRLGPSCLATVWVLFHDEWRACPDL